MTKNKANPNFLYLKKNVPEKRVTLLQGGTRSGKTRAGIDYLIWLCNKYPDAGIEIDIVRETLVACKATVWSDFEKVLKQYGIYNEDDHHKSEQKYTLFGNTINYLGADHPAKLHGKERDILWVNEAHLFPEVIIDQLFPRTKYRIICDYNPALGLRHWLDDYIGRYSCLITTYKDNPHLPKSQIEDIESKRNKPYWWKIYGSGLRSSREGVIFENWEQGEFIETDLVCYGLDWGYYPDPLAIIKVSVDKAAKKIYLCEVGYDTNVNDVLTYISARIPEKKSLIICDTNEERTRQTINKAGYNIQKARKNQIVADIREIENYTLIVAPGSQNLIVELSTYVWNDKKASVPIGEFNHLMDAMRYAVMRLIRGGGVLASG